MKHTKTPVCFRIDANLLEMVRFAAKRDHRTLTNYFEVALRDSLKEDARKQLLSLG